MWQQLPTHPQQVTRVEELRPQIVEEVKPYEQEDVDAHPDHLQTQPPRHTTLNYRRLSWELAR